MILNVGARTDIVNHYSTWLLERFRDGFVYARNPLFPNRVTKYEISPEQVDAVLFCSKNYAPMLGMLHTITEKYRTYFHYTITAYGKDVEPNVPDLKTSVRTLKELSALVGRKKLAWRYDPVLLTPAYSVKRHLETFSYLCGQIAPYVSRCIFSFVEMYAKLSHNMPELIPLTDTQKDTIAKGLAQIAAKNRLPIQTCSTRDTFPQYGISVTGCVTLDVLGKANHCVFRDIKHNGLRRGCLCIESRDVGWYDTCPNFCRYCYANKSEAAVRENIKLHDVHSPLLIGHLNADDILIQGNQTSYLKNDGRQISLFDL